eukprot:646452-Pleurochrysis_carterae.AAC.6
MPLPNELRVCGDHSFLCEVSGSRSGPGALNGEGERHARSLDDEAACCGCIKGSCSARVPHSVAGFVCVF